MIVLLSLLNHSLESIKEFTIYKVSLLQIVSP